MTKTQIQKTLKGKNTKAYKIFSNTEGWSTKPFTRKNEAINIIYEELQKNSEQELILELCGIDKQIIITTESIVLEKLGLISKDEQVKKVLY